MSYQLKIDKVLEALVASDHPQAPQFVSAIEEATLAAAKALAEHLGIMAGDTTFDGMAFAGTCTPFFAIYRGQPLPAVFKENGFDNAEEWGPAD